MKLRRIFEYINHKFLLICDAIQKHRRTIYMKGIQVKLKNHDLSLISNNCNGGVILHDLGLPFNSQFVNLGFDADDYIRYLEKFDYYNSLTPVITNSEDVKAGHCFPKGIIGDIRVRFTHYHSEREAIEKWEDRKTRINTDNMFVILTQQSDCTYDHLRRFDALPFKNKVVFTFQHYPEIKSSYYVESYKNNPKGVYMFLEFRNHFSKYRRYDVFDWVSWFNGDIDINKME